MILRWLKSPAVVLVCVDIAISLVTPAGDARSMLDAHAAKLQGAQSLTATVTVQTIGGAKEERKIWLSRPDRFKIEGPAGYSLSDGKTIWTYAKTDNSYSEIPFDRAELLARFKSDDIWPWSAFFDADAFKKAAALKGGAKKNLRGNEVQPVTMSLAEQSKSADLYIDSALGFARGALLTKSQGSASEEILIVASDIKISVEALPETSFAFTAPQGSKKVEKQTEPQHIAFAQIASIFRRQCMPCHGSTNRKGGLDLSSY